MDARQYMIVDLKRKGDKRMFITEQVASIQKKTNGYWQVCFLSSPRVFQYNYARLLYLTHPETINLENKGLYINNRHIMGADELLRFSHEKNTFYRVVYEDGRTECLEGRNVYVTRTPIDKTGGSTWDYLRKIAEETGLQSDNGVNTLTFKYDLVDVKRDNVPLAQYLGDKTQLATYNLPHQVYYPFGCNASQKTAVEAALTHQVSFIQGPPGTGKTQTVLNIIANLLLANKTVLIVSNNNSAVENIAEKLQTEGLDFLIAPLGNAERKETFIENQSSAYPDMTSWHISNLVEVQEQAKEALLSVSLGFDSQTKLALLRAEYDALMTEEHYDNLLKEGQSHPDWLNHKRSEKLMKLLTRCQMLAERDRKPSLWFCLKWMFFIGIRAFSFLRGNLTEVVAALEQAYYCVRKLEIEQELGVLTEQLQTINLQQNLQALTTSSLQVLKSRIAQRYGHRVKQLFTIKGIKTKTEAFLKEYPIVLSTTYSAKSCIGKDMVFDYVIMDEASQSDIKTGALALSCATNAVIVGDDKQLPNVVTQEEALAIRTVLTSFQVDERYNAITHNFLQSCTEIFRDAPTTLLREHYRCHPLIIEFCNQRFYNGELIPMTNDSGEEKVLKVVRTVQGNHANKHINQREIDVLVQEVMPQYADKGSVGIITPYSDQAKEINAALGQDIASTVHKYQGRECDTIILTTVDNVPTTFSDDDNLLNVAISRAKKQFCIVTTGNELSKDTNLSQLISYIRYNNFEIQESRLHSVFDLLYRQYSAERLAYEKEHLKVSDYLSENLVYDTLMQALSILNKSNLSVVCHYPLFKLIADWTLLNEEEKSFAGSKLAHVDFLVYNSLTKQALLTIEVDGWHFHKGNVVQQSRDSLKDQVLSKYALAPIRLATTDIVTVESLKAMLEQHL
ncbi:AAA domain-containing protein [Alloprevotella sp. Lung230]|uniref:AAA domain-containing protein n=1 Tax=Alloprevotella sp. Lung230 TaxID=2766595 RepID=UPI001655B9BF|nr:AAA domain-containing protein [Alloprevotella sp. Lung230]MBC8626971.1 AAA family ATPase [Alloprevotella sp. Lung230]